MLPALAGGRAMDEAGLVDKEDLGSAHTRARGKRQLVAAQAARVAILGFQFHGSSSLSRLIG